jgi:hypothetical protein
VVTPQLADRKAFAWDVMLTASHGNNKSSQWGRVVRSSAGYASGGGLPIDALFYRPYTFSDATPTARIQPNRKSWSIPPAVRGLSVARSCRCGQHRALLAQSCVSPLFDYKGSLACSA